MALDASDSLASQQLGGTRVTKRGFSTGMGKSTFVGGPIAAGITRGILGRKSGKQKASAAESSAPEFGTVGYLAVTADEVALLRVGVKKSGVGNVLGDVVARVPRSQVASADFESASMFGSGVIINFNDGQSWILEAPRQDRKKAEELVETLVEHVQTKA
jgi:hypothetical protein